MVVAANDAAPTNGGNASGFVQFEYSLSGNGRNVKSASNFDPPRLGYKWLDGLGIVDLGEIGPASNRDPTCFLPVAESLAAVLMGITVGRRSTNAAPSRHSSPSARRVSVCY